MPQAVVTGRWALCAHLPLSCAFFWAGPNCRIYPSKPPLWIHFPCCFPSGDTLGKLPCRFLLTQAAHGPRSPWRPRMLTSPPGLHTTPHRRQRLAFFSSPRLSALLFATSRASLLSAGLIAAFCKSLRTSKTIISFCTAASAKFRSFKRISPASHRTAPGTLGTGGQRGAGRPGW